MKVILLAVLFVLAGCATPAKVPFSQAEAQSRVLQAETYYEAVLTVAVAYNQRPRCTAPKTVTLCSDPGAVAEIRKANQVALAAFGAAANTANTPNITADAVNAAITAATNATVAFNTVVSTYR